MIRVVWLLAILFSIELWAQNSCIDQLQGRQNSFNHLEVYQNNHYKLERLIDGKWGGKLLAIRLWDTETLWSMEQLEEYGNAPGGNPMWFVKVMPQSVADFFQFKILDHNQKPVPYHEHKKAYQVVIPDVQEVNSALAKLDQVLKRAGHDGIPFRFYLDREISSNFNFLKNYRDQLGLPFSMDPNISYHDLNYHLMPMLVLDRRLIERSVLMADVFLKFSEFLKARYPKVATDSVLSSMLGIRAIHLDTLGNVIPYLVNDLSKEKLALAVRAIKGYVGFGLSPLDYLGTVIEIKSKDAKDLILKDVTLKMVKEFGKTLGAEYKTENPEVKKWLEDPNNTARMIQARLQKIDQALQVPRVVSGRTEP